MAQPRPKVAASRPSKPSEFKGLCVSVVRRNASSHQRRNRSLSVACPGGSGGRGAPRPTAPQWGTGRAASLDRRRLAGGGSVLDTSRRHRSRIRQGVVEARSARTSAPGRGGKHAVSRALPIPGRTAKEQHGDVPIGAGDITPSGVPFVELLELACNTIACNACRCVFKPTMTWLFCSRWPSERS